MAITLLSQNLDFISALPTTPSSPDYTAQQVKAEFDKAGNIIKDYINNTLIPQIVTELASTVTGDGAYRYIPGRVLLTAYNKPGSYTFSTAEFESFNGLYDVICIGGGGGGYFGEVSSGGGAGGVTQRIGIQLDGTYSVTVGAAGACVDIGEGSWGGITQFSNLSYGGTLMISATGGYGGRDGCGGRSGGIGGGDGTALQTNTGAGGDCYGYGRGARGSPSPDSARSAEGYGSGGWGYFAPAPGAVLIYGYKKEVIS